MEFSSSPMAPPRSDVVPASPGFNPKKAIYVSDSDEETDELQTNVPESSPYFTQPTQIVNRTTLQPTSARLTSSSPKSEIEVPVSSPIPPRKPTTMAGGRIASMMAPAGTAYRAPHQVQKINPPKRKYDSDDDELEEPIYVADSSDDDRPARGDIRPSSFKPRQTTPPSAPKLQSEKQTLSVRTVQVKPVAEARLLQLAKKMQTNLRNEYSFEACKKALQANGLNMDNAAKFLRSKPAGKQNSASQPTIAKAFARASSDATRNSSVTSSPASSQSSSRSASSSRTSQAPSTPSPLPVKTRGRLQRGLKPRNSPRSSQIEVAQKSNHRTELIDLISEDELDVDAYSSDSEPSSQASSAVVTDSTGNARILEYLETCTVDSLMAITKMKASEKDRAEAMVKNRPYQSLDQARAVSLLKSGKVKGKRSKMAVGETIVDKLTQFVETLDAIGQVVDMCDRKGMKINDTLSHWNVDRSGRKQSSETLVDLPFPCEPKPMQGMCTLQPYQLFGMNWLWQLYTQNFGCILADDMGLGKTCQVIAFISLLVSNYHAGIVKGEQPWPVLIVVPPSTLANWEAEFDKFSSGLEIITYSGSQQERNEIAYEIRDSPKDYHVVLTSYSQLGRHEDISAMRHIKPHVAVFDEAHKLKTPTANIYRQLIRIEADWKLFLTGTPVQNNIMEMVALLNFINPHLFSNHLEALEDLFQHRASLQEVSQGAVLQDDRVSRARSILEPFILQRKKEEVLTTLPAKTRRVVYCDLFDNQKSIYREYEGNYRREVRRAIGRLNGRSDDQNNPWMQLRKAAIHGQLFRRYFTDKKVEEMGKTLMKRVPQSRLMQEDLGKLVQELKGESDFHLHLWCRDEPCIASYDVPENSWMESGKVQKLLELIREFEKNGDRVLVFSKFVMVLEILEECLASAKIKYRILKGDTKVDERQNIINEFNGDSSIPVFLLTTGAGGTGINLTSANKVIIFDQSDNPQDDIQAENRAHRFGQTREVEIIRLLTKGTIEELVHKACQRKLELAGKITGYAEDISSKAIEAEVREMLTKEDQGDSP